MIFDEDMIAKYYGKKHRKKLTQSEIAEGVGCSKKTIQNFFANNDHVSKKMADRIMEYIDSRPEYVTVRIPVRSD